MASPCPFSGGSDVRAGVFLDSGSLGQGDIDLSGIEATLPRWSFHDATAPAEVAERICDAEVVITNKVVLGAEQFAAAGHLRLVCVSATGVDNVDLSAASRRNITVCNVTAYATPSVVQHVFALMFALAIRLPDYHAAVRAGRWQQSRHFALLDYPFAELAGRTLGIVGYGELGRAVAAAAKCFGMDVVIAARPGTAPKPGRVALDELLGRIDVLSLHCPLTDATRGLIGTRELARMKPGALLINAARGGIVDEAALAAALRSGVIGGAGVDVLESEPPHQGSSLLAPDIPNLIVTPHIAWASRESRQRLVDGLRDNIEAFIAGRPRNVVGS
jgi:glycerate dehydrogenase